MEHDVVNKPKHYLLLPNVEVRDVCRALSRKVLETDMMIIPDDPLFVSDYVQMMQYGMRFMDKNGKEDLLKMRWYLDKLIDAYDQ
jgi:hypothetical protein